TITANINITDITTCHVLLSLCPVPCCCTVRYPSWVLISNSINRVHVRGGLTTHGAPGHIWKPRHSRGPHEMPLVPFS
ncbi:unnamed protein product, partial [Staurois parvus]